MRLLRRGPVEIDAARQVASRAIEAPGQLASHYAPKKPLRLDASEARDGEYLIGFGPVAGDVTLSKSGDPIEAAARLFDLLHQADAAPQPRIAVAPIPGDGIAAAIRDRLKRAAAPSDMKNGPGGEPAEATSQASNAYLLLVVVDVAGAERGSAAATGAALTANGAGADA